jgi:hypothetical protein
MTPDTHGSPESRSVTATASFDRCRCRPGCLARLTPDDTVVLLDEGYALTEHAMDATYPVEQLALDVNEAAS